MAVAKRHGREKPSKIEQRKHSWVAQFTQRRPGGRGKNTQKEAPQGRGPSLFVARSLSLFSSRLLGQHTPRGCIFLYFLNKTEL